MINTTEGLIQFSIFSSGCKQSNPSTIGYKSRYPKNIKYDSITFF